MMTINQNDTVLKGTYQDCAFTATPTGFVVFDEDQRVVKLAQSDSIKAEINAERAKQWIVQRNATVCWLDD